MTFPLEEKLDEIQNDINTQLKDINQEYNMDLKADLYSITSEHFEMKPGAIETTIKASLKIEAYIKDLRKLGAPIQKIIPVIFYNRDYSVYFIWRLFPILFCTLLLL